MADRGDVGPLKVSKPILPITAVLTLALFEFLVAVQGWLAYRDHFLTPSQMLDSGVSNGLPFLAHLGMWGDVFIVSPLAAFIVGRFSNSWRSRWVVTSLIVGVALSVLMGWSYLSAGLPEAHVQSHQLTPAGWVHQVYMALALAIFVQFFIFTRHVPKPVLSASSIALIFHVLLGTHIILGLFTFIHPIAWYPAEPLRSHEGWAVVLSVGTILFFRCVGREALILTYVFLTMEDPTTSEGYLKLLNRVCDLTIATTYFIKLFFSKLENGTSGLQLGLFLMIAIKYFLSRTSVKQELEIAKALFPPGKVPDVLKPKSRIEITLLVFGFLVFYWILGVTYDHILIASLLLTGIACNDMHTRFNVSSDMLKTFSLRDFMPDKSTSSGKKIEERRDVARWYLEDNNPRQSRFLTWTSAKEAFSIIGSAVAFGIAVLGWLRNENLDFEAYWILLATQVANEIVTVWWRVDRFRRLVRIDRSPAEIVAPNRGAIDFKTEAGPR
ncbi:hypothetical protein [Bradyrhizobium genosp. A]|uniref:hypothetical protein n=1 Tax=Bradyrhizobium genosp. A TaxID=83626 RepID=UPI003CE77614